MEKGNIQANFFQKLFLLKCLCLDVGRYILLCVCECAICARYFQSLKKKYSNLLSVCWCDKYQTNLNNNRIHNSNVANRKKNCIFFQQSKVREKNETKRFNERDGKNDEDYI